VGQPWAPIDTTQPIPPRLKPGVSILERAFGLAKTGRFNSVTELQKTLSAEGYVSSSVIGPALRRQLLTLIREANGGKPRPRTSKGTHRRP
jgi:hypothetical protein